MENEKYIINKLDSMSVAEARRSIAEGAFGDPGTMNYAFASNYLASKESEIRDAREAEILSISRKSLSISRTARMFSISAAIIAAIAMIWSVMKVILKF